MRGGKALDLRAVVAGKRLRSFSLFVKCGKGILIIFLKMNIMNVTKMNLKYNIEENFLSVTVVKKTGLYQ